MVDASHAPDTRYIREVPSTLDRIQRPELCFSTQRNIREDLPKPFRQSSISSESVQGKPQESKRKVDIV